MLFTVFIVLIFGVYFSGFIDFHCGANYPVAVPYFSRLAGFSLSFAFVYSLHCHCTNDADFFSQEWPDE